jgi:hypothetical protein
MISKLDIFVVDPIELQIQKSKTKNKFGAFLTLLVCFICVIAFVLLTILNELKQPIITTEIISTSTLNKPINARIEWNTDLVDTSTILPFELITDNAKGNNCVNSRSKSVNNTNIDLCYFSKDLIGEENGSGFVFKLNLKNNIKPILPFVSTDSIVYNVDNRYIYLQQTIKNKFCVFDLLINSRYCFNYNSNYGYNINKFVTVENGTVFVYVSIHDNTNTLYLFKNHELISKEEQNKSMFYFNPYCTFYETSKYLFLTNTISNTIYYISNIVNNNDNSLQYIMSRLYVDINDVYKLDLFNKVSTNELYLNINKYTLTLTNNNTIFTQSNYTIILYDENWRTDLLDTNLHMELNGETLYIIVKVEYDNIKTIHSFIKTINLHTNKVYNNTIVSKSNSDSNIITCILYANKNKVTKGNSVFRYIEFSLLKNYKTSSTQNIYFINKDATYQVFKDITNFFIGFHLYVDQVERISPTNYYIYLSKDSLPTQYNNWTNIIKTGGVLDCNILSTTNLTIDCQPLFSSSFNINSNDNNNLDQKVASVYFDIPTFSSISKIDLTVRDVLGYQGINNEYKINTFGIINKDNVFSINSNNYKTLYIINVLTNDDIVIANQQKIYRNRNLYSISNLNTGHDIKFNCITKMDENNRLESLIDFTFIQNQIDCPIYKQLEIPFIFDDSIIYRNILDKRYLFQSTNLTGVFLLNLNENFYFTKSTPTKDSIFKIIGSIGGIFSSLLTAFMFIKNTWWKRQHKKQFDDYTNSIQNNSTNLSEIKVSIDDPELTDGLEKVKYIQQIDDTINIQLSKLRNQSLQQTAKINNLYN